MNVLTSKDFKSLFLSSTHLIDVRSPVEFQDGAVPGAVNLPLLVDEERRQIGIAYKIHGKEAAIKLGHELVCGGIRDQRIQLWMDEIKKYPNSTIYCFRGGLRSQISQTWIREAGIDRPLIVGGYKALRNFFLDSIRECSEKLNFLVVSGPTGAGKTDYLKKSGKPFLDLEAIAKHRGSAFGAMSEPQPNQVNFENTLAVELLKLSNVEGPILVERESRKVGRNFIPDVLYEKIKFGPKIVLEVSVEERVENIFRDYVVNTTLGLNNDVEKFTEYKNSVLAISKKLGGLRTQEILNDLESCKREFEAGHGLDSNRTWIKKLITWYYDPLYKGQYFSEIASKT